MDSLQPVEPDDAIVKSIRQEISNSKESLRQRALKKLGLAAISAIPWVGGFAAAALELRDNPEKLNDLQRQWLEIHEQKLGRLQDALHDISSQLESFGDDINKRIESPEFLALVGKGFRQWDEATTEEKRQFVTRLLANAAATSLCSDDLIRLFLEWIRKYDETHFRVIKAIYNKSGVTRRKIWMSMHPTIPKDSSSDADLFKLLIHDLSLGHVIRQYRPTNFDGEFIKKSKTGASRPSGSSTMKSPFDDSDGYELTELGSQFVHYVMKDVAPQLGNSSGN